MQLTKSNVTGALLAASCSLVGTSVRAEGWDVDTAIMYYGESDRVTAVEGIVQGNKTFSGDARLNAKIVVDSLTGASANGAVPQADAQTFTSPSGNGQYTAASGETPLDDTFKDTRVQGNLQWTQPLGENYTGSTGIHISNEYDYQSLAINGLISRDLNMKNTTLSLGVSYAMDSLDPVGGRPVGLSEMVVDLGQFADEESYRAAFDATRQTDGEDSKNTLDVVLGLTQVINRRWITQFNIGMSQVDGYLSDPYKVVSVVDNEGLASSQRYEHRPDSRAKQTFFAQSKYHFEKNVWDISYRFATDDWGINSHTLESRLRMPVGSSSYLEPHVRLYQQNEADFYTPFLLDGETLPEYASADYRIGKLNAYTLGLRYGRQLANGHEFGMRLEYYSQAPQDIGKEAPGQLKDFDLFPSVDALVLQFDYKF